MPTAVKFVKRLQSHPNSTRSKTDKRIFRGVEDLDQDVDEDIVPGGDVSFGDLPYVAAVFNALRKFHTCTGAIIHKSVVLTAGYCVMESEKIVDPGHVSVLGGVVDMRDHDYDQWRFAVAISESVATYKGMKALVLIKVNSPFFMNYSLKTIKFPNHTFTGSSVCTAVTWRFRDKLNRVTLRSLVLKEYWVYILNQSFCQSRYSSNPVLFGFEDVNFICLSFVAPTVPNSKDYECVGIDGSMIFCKDSGEFRPIGVASTLIGGSTCNRADNLYTFFDLGASFEWIMREIHSLLLS